MCVKTFSFPQYARGRDKFWSEACGQSGRTTMAMGRSAEGDVDVDRAKQSPVHKFYNVKSLLSFRHAQG